MSEWKAKRFWDSAAVVACDGGFTVELDGRPVRTPSKALLVMPSEEMAKRVAAEWDAQEGEIKPLTMPFTRSVNSAIDKVSVQHTEVAEMLAAYGDADVTCYRADSPAELVLRQDQAWNPLLEWAASTLKINLKPVTGVIHAPQSEQSQQQILNIVAQMDAFQLTGFHDLVTLSGSVVIAFAAVHDYASCADLWGFSRIDELWQEEQWGQDEAAGAEAETKYQAFQHAHLFSSLCTR